MLLCYASRSNSGANALAALPRLVLDVDDALLAGDLGHPLAGGGLDVGGVVAGFDAIEVVEEGKQAPDAHLGVVVGVLDGAVGELALRSAELGQVAVESAGLAPAASVTLRHC